MKFSIVIHSPPYSSQGSHSALRFCEAVLAQGHEIHRLFFFRGGVDNLDDGAVTGQDELNLQQAWAALVSQHGLDTIACVTSALKRGVFDRQQASRFERSGPNIVAGTEISGLGQLVDAIQASDRVINFG